MTVPWRWYLSTSLGIFILHVQFSYQVPVREDFDIPEVAELHPDQYADSEHVFGQRLNHVHHGPSSRSASSRPVDPSPPSLPPITTTLHAFTEKLQPQQRSLLTGDPIIANKSDGSCVLDNRLYHSGESIERNHQCHFCFCRNSYIDCYWKNCPPAPEGCMELNFDGTCDRSLYICPIPKKNAPNRVPYPASRSSRIYRQNRYRNNNHTRLGCEILGVHYRIGELVGVATDPCLECRCADDSLYCSPKCCFQPSEPNDEVGQQLQRSDNERPLLNNPLHHLRSEFEAFLR